jgi:hypothetical protein
MQDKDTSNHHDSLPFFTRFLEGQNKTEPSALTFKFPSDVDEGDMTMKYPSDNDEGVDRIYGS